MKNWLLLILSLSFLAVFTQESEPRFTTLRHAYERGETCTLELSAPDATKIVFDVDGWFQKEAPVAEGKAVYTFDTTPLRAQDYTVRARVTKGGSAEEDVVFFPLTIGPRHNTERMPVWRWGSGGGDPEWWQERGFTGAFLSSIKDPLSAAIKDPVTDPSAADTERFLLDRATKHDYELGMYFYPLLSPRWENEPDVFAILPNGNPKKGKPHPLDPRVVEHAKKTVDTWMQAVGDYPSMRHTLLQSEYQTPYSINEFVVDMAREELDIDMREFFDKKGMIIPGAAENGIIDDDNPRYRFLQWWWQRGHGTALLNKDMHDIVTQYRPDAITWHDPYRLAPVRNSHIGLDCIGTWTYGYPDIRRLCYTTYLQAAARPHNQLVNQDITLFVYGRFALPPEEFTANLDEDFAGRDPYWTASPDYAREATWLVVSQRPDILCYYSAGRLSPDREGLDPYYYSPETFHAIGETCEALVEPYGPAILKSKRYPAKVAVLMSAASAWFSDSERLPGYPTEQTLPYATLLLMNHVPFEVVLDADILDGALENYDVLVMPRADTLLRSMYEKIKAFSESGGTVIADSSLRASLPNAKITDYDFSYQRRMDGPSLMKDNAVTADEHRAIMRDYAAQLAPLLEEIHRPAASASTEVLTNTLEGGGARYYFFVNDKRTYGPRFGEWKLRYEIGVPQTAEMSVALDGRPVLYDALMRQRMEYEEKEGRAAFTDRLPGARGKLVVALPEPIGSVSVETPDAMKPGDEVRVTARVLGESGEALPCVIPLRVEVLDALGRETEWTRHTATEDGSRTYTFVPAVNDARGEWTVRVTELLGGTTAEKALIVQ